MQQNNKNKLILNALARTVKKLRGAKSQFMFASENDISTSIISNVERGLKDPQFTTIFKLAEAFDMDVCEFVKLIKEELPDDFYLIDK